LNLISFISVHIQIFTHSIGVEELEQSKSAPLLQLKYGSTRDVVGEIGRVVSGF